MLRNQEVLQAAWWTFGEFETFGKHFGTSRFNLIELLYFVDVEWF